MEAAYPAVHDILRVIADKEIGPGLDWKIIYSLSIRMKGH